MNKDYEEAVENIDYTNLIKEIRGEALTERQQADCNTARKIYDAMHGLTEENEEGEDEDV